MNPLREGTPSPAAQRLLTRLQRLLNSEAEHAFAIGDLVNCLKREHALRVKDVAASLGASRQRLSELRRTASAFPPHQRRFDVDFHFYTIAARAARRLDMAGSARCEVRRCGSPRRGSLARPRAARRRAATPSSYFASACGLSGQNDERSSFLARAARFPRGD